MAAHIVERGGKIGYGGKDGQELCDMLFLLEGQLYVDVCRVMDWMYKTKYYEES